MRPSLIIVTALCHVIGCAGAELDESEEGSADAQITSSDAGPVDTGPGDASETTTSGEEILQVAPDAASCGDPEPECEPPCGFDVHEEATCIDGQWECPPVDGCPPNPVECPEEGEMSAMDGAVCIGAAGLVCAYTDGAYEECPGGAFHCSCGDNSFWSCDCSM